jgi:hypothetical protein
MNNKITLKRRETYEAFAGEVSLGIFDIESEWNGFAKLKSTNGELIVNRASPATQVIGAIFGAEETVEVIKASPSLGAVILGQNVKVHTPLPATASDEMGVKP